MMPPVRRWVVVPILSLIALYIFYQLTSNADVYSVNPSRPPSPHTPSQSLPDPSKPQPDTPSTVEKPAESVPDDPTTKQPVEEEPEEPDAGKSKSRPGSHDGSVPVEEIVRWSARPDRYSVTSMIALPTGQPERIARVQHSFVADSGEATVVREERLKAVKNSFQHSWDGYRTYAWLKDEVTPLSGKYRNSFGGWAATLVDTLDTLWIMGMKEDFEQAVKAVEKIDFTTTEDDAINVFETTIRYLGGLLGAYDLSGGQHQILLDKAIEIGNFLYSAFDTPNRLPVTRWLWKAYVKGNAQAAGGLVLVSEIGSLSLEFTRLSQITNDTKYFDAIQRVMDVFETSQEKTKLPGMWPVVVDAAAAKFTEDSSFTLGGMSDSLYEYLPKQYLLLGGLQQQYRTLYEKSIEPIKKHIFFRPMTEDNRDILLAGDARVSGKDEVSLEPRSQHLACFSGGMVGLGAKIFNRPEELTIATKLVNGCMWAYENTVTGIMPEIFHAVPCSSANCTWDKSAWYSGIAARQKENFGAEDKMGDERIKEAIKSEKLSPGFTEVTDRRYILRPEAIESLFIMYRITGNTTLQDKAWQMFTSIEKYTRTDIASSAINDVTTEKPMQVDRMESFWLAETLKYFYLIFADPSVVSLDDYVLNTEAHPFKRLKPQ